MKSRYIFLKKCNFCGDSNRGIIYRFERQRIVCCDTCHLIYLDKQRIDLKNLYDRGYYLKSESSVVANYTDYKNQEKVVKENFRFAYKFIERNMDSGKNTLLDIGAGFGYFIKYLPKKIQCKVIEVSKEAAEAIRSNTNAKVYEGNFLDVNIKNKFNMIVSFDVIEHQNNLKKYLNKVNLLLKKNGMFMFTTPDFDSRLNKIFKQNAPLIQPLYHNYYFDKNWIKKNIPKLGYEIISIKTVYLVKLNIGHIILMGYFAIPWLKRIRLLEFVSWLNINNITIPFIRFGGIECILKKVN